MNLIPDYLREICMQSIILRFILAVLCSGLIGLSRGKRHHAAGFRTHLLVCVGAAPVMMIKSADGDETYGNLTKDSVKQILTEIKERS